MLKKILIGLLAFVLLIGLCAWAPWLTPRVAGYLAEMQFNAAWSFVMDGCGTNCSGCGAREVQKVLFGAYVTLDFQCGLIPPNEPLRTVRVFVSFLGTMHGIPRP